MKDIIQYNGTYESFNQIAQKFDIRGAHNHIDLSAIFCIDNGVTLLLTASMYIYRAENGRIKAMTSAAFDERELQCIIDFMDIYGKIYSMTPFQFKEFTTKYVSQNILQYVITFKTSEVVTCLDRAESITTILNIDSYDVKVDKDVCYMRQHVNSNFTIVVRDDNITINFNNTCADTKSIKQAVMKHLTDSMCDVISCNEIYGE